jgi:hypothetical protein
MGIKIQKLKKINYISRYQYIKKYIFCEIL